jgi:hypothetical protein
MSRQGDATCVAVRLSIGAICLLLAACSSERSCGQAMLAPVRSCAAGVSYQGHFYMQWSDKMPAPRGALLGRAVFPGCNDTGDCASASSEQSPTQVWTLKGVDPQVAVVGRDQGSGKFVVFARVGSNADKYFHQSPDGRWHLRQRAADE